MVLHFAPYPLAPYHFNELHQSRNKDHLPTLPHRSQKTRGSAMTPGYMSHPPDVLCDTRDGDRSRTDKMGLNCILRHTTGRVASPENIGATPALQRAREEALDRTLQARKSQSTPPLVALPSFRESFPQALSEPTELTPNCAFTAPHEKYLFKAAPFSSANFAPQRHSSASKMSINSHVYMGGGGSHHQDNLVNRPRAHLNYGSVRDADIQSLLSSSDDDASSVSSGSGLDSNTEANYSPKIRPTTEYRYPPLLPEPGFQQRLDETTPRYLHNRDNHSAPPSSSSSRSSEKQNSFQILDGGRGGITDRPRRAPPRPSGNDGLKWLEYAEEVRDENGAASFQCRWEKGGRLPTACDYRAQKQAMKRHVEATHLKYRPHKCSFCPRAYSQKTALEVHEATHTGATPHDCLYACGKAFSDPARRYRHHVEAHGYIPRQSNKKHGNAQMRVVRDKVQYGT